MSLASVRCASAHSRRRRVSAPGVIRPGQPRDAQRAPRPSASAARARSRRGGPARRPRAARDQRVEAAGLGRQACRASLGAALGVGRRLGALLLTATGDARHRATTRTRPPLHPVHHASKSREDALDEREGESRMQGLMSSVSADAHARLRPGGAALPREGRRDGPGRRDRADHLRRMGRAHAPAGGRARRAGDLRRRPRRHVRLEHRAPPRALLRRALQRPRPAHAEHPPVPGRHRLHRQPRRGRGRLRRPLAAEGLLAAGRPASRRSSTSS